MRQAQAAALSKAHEASVQMEEQLAQHADKVRLPSRTCTLEGARARSFLSTLKILNCSARAHTCGAPLGALLQILSDLLRIIGLLSRCLTNYLILRFSVCGGVSHLPDIPAAATSPALLEDLFTLTIRVMLPLDRHC